MDHASETASFRFTKTERSPFSSSRDDVRMDRATRRWTGGADVPGGAMPTAAPLDELSFIFFLRTLRLGNGDGESFIPLAMVVRARSFLPCLKHTSANSQSISSSIAQNMPAFSSINCTMAA